jgi:hypothetical protein
MEQDWQKRAAAEEAARKAFYDEEVAKAKMARVSQLVSGEVVIRPPEGTLSPKASSPKSHSPGEGDLSAGSSD